MFVLSGVIQEMEKESFFEEEADVSDDEDVQNSSDEDEER